MLLPHPADPISALVAGSCGGLVRWLHLLSCSAGYAGSFLPEPLPGAPQPAFLAYRLKFYETEGESLRAEHRADLA